jgi:hypothetical protein
MGMVRVLRTLFQTMNFGPASETVVAGFRWIKVYSW